MQNVNLVLSVVVQEFPAGTVDDGVYVYTIVENGSTILSQTSAETSVTFANVNAGSYTATASKNGVSVSADFVVAQPTVSINVPATLVVTLS